MRVSSPELAAEFAACREAIRGGSRSFYAASLVLPLAVRLPAYALYAFCRLADDAVDGDGGRGAVSDCRDRLARAYAGQPRPAAADRAFAAVVRDHAIPRDLPEALLEGLAWDARGRRYETLDDLHAYAARVAGTVGVMMTLLMGVRDRDVLARACDLGIAMQLTNIARDVGEDARMGRLYLPLAWLRAAGIDPEPWLAAPRMSPALAGVVARLLAEADALYRRAESGIARLPQTCRPAIMAARSLYAGIGHEVERNGFDSVSRRAIVPPRRKAALLTAALARVPLLRGGDLDAPPLDPARFLIDAVPDPPVAANPAWWDLDGQVRLVVDLLMRLEQRDRLPLVAADGVPRCARSAVLGGHHIRRMTP